MNCVYKRYMVILFFVQNIPDFVWIFLTQRLFGFARRGTSDGGSMFLACDRLNEDHNKAKAKRIKSKRAFWVIWSSD